MDLVINVVMGLIGIVFYNVIAFRRFLNTSDLSSKVFWQSYFTESKFIWIWSVSVIVLVALIVRLAPDAAEALTKFTGWQIGTNPVSYLTLALAVSAMKDAKKK